MVDLHQCVEQAHCYNTIGSHVCKALDEDEEEEDEDEDYESEEGKNKEDGDIKVENEKMDGRKEESESTEDANEEGASGEKEGGNEEKKVEEKNYKKEEENGGGVKLEPVESTDNSGLLCLFICESLSPVSNSFSEALCLSCLDPFNVISALNNSFLKAFLIFKAFFPQSKSTLGSSTASIAPPQLLQVTEALLKSFLPLRSRR